MDSDSEWRRRRGEEGQAPKYQGCVVGWIRVTVASDLLGSPASWMSLADDARRPRTVTAAAAPAPRQTATATATTTAKSALERRLVVWFVERRLVVWFSSTVFDGAPQLIMLMSEL